MDDKKQIDFKFHKNWKSFLVWYETYNAKARCAPMWDMQTQKIEECFSSTASSIVNWKKLWADFAIWCKKTMVKNEVILWSEQKRQIETLMLGQLSELGKEQFILVFLHKGKPEFQPDKMTYWEAVRLKGKLEGNENGQGGNEDMDNITIVNLNKLIQ